MRYAIRSLLPGETLQYTTTVHWFVYFTGKDRRWIWPFILFAGLVAGAIFVEPTPIDYITTTLKPTAASILLPVTSRTLLLAGATIAAVVTIGFLVPPFINRRTTELAITNRRLIYKRGIIWRFSREVNLSQIESVDVGQSILGRLLGYGEVAVRGTGGSWDPIPTISRPLIFRSHITAADLHRARSA